MARLLLSLPLCGGCGFFLLGWCLPACQVGVIEKYSTLGQDGSVSGSDSGVLAGDSSIQEDQGHQPAADESREIQDATLSNEDAQTNNQELTALEEAQLDQPEQNTYPSGPYGSAVGSTIEDLCVEECICSPGNAQGQMLCLDSFLDRKVTLISVHAGWCPDCSEQASTMESDLYSRYHDQGLGIILALVETDGHETNREVLLNYCCQEKENYGITFHMVINPTGSLLDTYADSPGVPLNVLLDGSMVIRYKFLGSYSEVQPSIEKLLNE